MGDVAHAGNRARAKNNRSPELLYDVVGGRCPECQEALFGAGENDSQQHEAPDEPEAPAWYSCCV
jgi:hypothetical protein